MGIFIYIMIKIPYPSLKRALKSLTEIGNLSIPSKQYLNIEETSQNKVILKVRTEDKTDTSGFWNEWDIHYVKNASKYHYWINDQYDTVINELNFKFTSINNVIKFFKSLKSRIYMIYLAKINTQGED